jgi:hypothetical protein
VQLREDIPLQLIPPAEAAVDWINQHRGTSYELTGLVDGPAQSLDGANRELELGLVLCDGDICAREQVHVTAHGRSYKFSLVTVEDAGIPALLDPPAGVRRSWLDDQMANFKFVLILFYRGRW